MITQFKNYNFRLTILVVFIIALLICEGCFLSTNTTSKPINFIGETNPTNAPAGITDAKSTDTSTDKTNEKNDIYKTKNIIIYNSHSGEKYSSGDSVKDAAKALEAKLSKSGLNSIFIDIPEAILRPEAYNISRKWVIDSSKEYDKSVLIDIHRDAMPSSESENNKNLLRIVVGAKNTTLYENSKFANSLLEELKNVNNIKAEVFISKGTTYNQDLSPNAILVE
jgi:stage II sporulation protein P